MDYTYIKNKLQDRGICIIIPTYNNANTIVDIINECKLYCKDIIVVNDGCSDDTKHLVDKLDGITIVENKINKGKGYALKIGFKKALELGFAYAITIDSDGQHYPKEISKFLNANVENPGALIIGNRDMNAKPRTRGSVFANKFSNFCFFSQTGVFLKDTQSGYRLYPLKKLYGLPLLTSRYEAELELLVFSSWHGIKIVPIPIQVYYPPIEDRVSHFKPKRDFARICVLNTVLCIMSIVYGLPLRLWRIFCKYMRTIISVIFCIFVLLLTIVPGIWLYVKLGTFTQDKKWKLHKFINWCAKMLMFQIGIPGAKFSCVNSVKEDFSKPSVIICNHQSHLDLMCKLIFTPKMIFLTNDWVWKNPFYGVIIRNADFFPIAEGLDNLIPKLKHLVEDGYHIAMYPEGTRSKDCSILRFHKGAFHIAKLLEVDILPIYLYGTGKILPKKTYIFNKSPIHIEIGKRISINELDAIGNARSQAAYMRKHYIEKYEQLCNKIEQDV